MLRKGQKFHVTAQSARDFREFRQTAIRIGAAALTDLDGIEPRHMQLEVIDPHRLASLASTFPGLLLESED